MVSTRDDMLSSMARGLMGKDLVAFFERNFIQADWGRQYDYGIDAMVSGSKLENLASPSLYLNGDKLNFEYLLHLRGPKTQCTVNLATILAMAAAFCMQEQQAARKATDAMRTRKPDDGVRRGRTKDRKMAGARRTKGRA